MLKIYFKNTSGNMASIFAVCLLMLMVAVGAAVDYNGITSKKNSYQNLADGAVLAAARSGETDRKALKEIAAKYVAEANTTNDNLKTRLKFNKGGHMQVTVKGKYDPVLMGMFGKKNEVVEALAEAPLPASEPVNIVLVLDTTYSMSGAKLSSLKSAANEMLGQLEKLKSDSIKVSVIPFSDYVNIGLSRRNEPWLDVSGDSVTPLPDSCYYPVIGTTNCRMEPTPYIPAQPAVPAGTCYNDGIAYACGGSSARSAVPAGSTKVCDNVYSTTQVCTTQTSSSSWHGCVGSRNAPWNVRVNYNGKKIPGLMDEWCGTEILPLTTDIAAAKATVSALKADGRTYLPAGLVWGWRALTPSDPLTEANAKFKRKRRSVMIFMTDGANTVSQIGSTHVGASAADANGLSKRLCTNINDSKIELFSIAYDMHSVTAKNILRGCATKPDMFFDARDSAELKRAFEEIGDSLIKIRLSH